MGGGTKLAIGILVMWLAMLFFFFAFHPHGVDLEAYGDNPAGMLQWIMNEFAKESGASTNGVAPVTSAQAAAAPNNAGAAPTETGA